MEPVEMIPGHFTGAVMRAPRGRQPRLVAESDGENHEAIVYGGTGVRAKWAVGPFSRCAIGGFSSQPLELLARDARLRAASTAGRSTLAITSGGRRSPQRL